MDKVFLINLAGVLFTIEEQAYQALKGYLEKLQQHFGSNGRDIVADIEYRMAELFQQRLKDSGNTLFSKDVNEVIAIMGDVNDMEGGETGQRESETLSPAMEEFKRNKKLRRNPFDQSLGGVCSGLAAYFEVDAALVRIAFVLMVIFWGTGILFYFILWMIIPAAKGAEAEYMMQRKMNQSKKLFRNSEDKVFGGVSSGMAAYFGLDVLWIRLAFVASFFFFGSGLLLYLVLWIIIPKALSASEKLQMRGETVDLRNIERESKTSGSTSRLHENPSKNRGVLATIARVVIAVFIFVSVTALLGFLIFGFTVYIGLGNENWFKQVATMLFAEPSIWGYLQLGIILCVLSPLAALISIGLRLFTKIKLNMRWTMVSLFIMFVAGTVLLLFSGVRYYSTVASEGIHEINSGIAPADTLYIEANTQIKADDEQEQTWETDGDEVVLNEKGIWLPLDFEIEKGSTDSLVLQLTKTARGSTKAAAMKAAEEVAFFYSISDNRIQLDPGILVDKNSRFYFQFVEATLVIPVGTYVVMSRETREMLDVKRYKKSDVFVMTNEGLRSTNPADNVRKDKKDKKRDAEIEISISDDDEEIVIKHDVQSSGKKKIKHGPVTIDVKESDNP